jgi:hypothetical protein
VLLCNSAFLTGGGGGTPVGGVSCLGRPGGRGGAALVNDALSQCLVAGDCSVRAGSAALPRCAPGTSAATGAGSLVHDPKTQFIADGGAPPIDPAMAVTARPVSSLRALQTTLAPGEFARWRHQDEPGVFVFTVLSIAAWPSVPHPIIFGGLHVDIFAALITGPLIVDGSGSLDISFFVPNDSALRGAQLFVATVGVNLRLEPTATCPSGLVIRLR